jgi:predicted kinase
VKVLYILCGVAFAGKSTLSKKIAEQKDATLVSQDALWFEKAKEWNLDEDSDKDWERVRQVSKRTVEEELAKGGSVVFDDINLTYRERDELRQIAKKYNAMAVVVYVDTPRQTQLQRQEKNVSTKDRHQVKQEHIDWALRKLEVPREDEKVFAFRPTSDITTWLRELP